MSKYTIIKQGDLWFAIRSSLIDENGNLTRDVNVLEGMASERLQDVKNRVWMAERLEDLQQIYPDADPVQLLMQVYQESLVADI